MSNERAEFVIKYMNGKADILEVDAEFSKVEFTIDSGNDLHNLFHAGTKAGINIAFNNH
jgi:hypothetical protein